MGLYAFLSIVFVVITTRVIANGAPKEVEPSSVAPSPGARFAEATD
jgi:hypothetical protein